MSAEQWKTVWEIYQQARDVGVDERTACIESLTADPDITREVISLLDADTDEPERAQQPASRQKGEKVGHYELIELLGRGGMAEVYSARDCDPGRTVALKFMLPDSGGHRNTIRRSIREARSASALNHSNIVTVYDVIHEAGEIVIAMELVEGRSLREFCGSPLDLQRVIGFGRQTALALAAAHAKGIIHRDIKPENLIARDDGVVKVLDFSLAREVASEASVETHSIAAVPAGTLRYMAPEQLRGERATAASDVFSLGAVLYELSTGRDPFETRHGWETAHASVSRSAAAPDSVNPAIPPGLASLILSMLAKGPDRRPSAGHVARMLEDPTALERGATWLRYWRPVVAAVLTGVAILAAVFVKAHWPTIPKSLTVTELTSLASENRVTAAVISPEGSQFVYAALDGIYLRNIESRSEKTPEAPPEFRCDRLAWLPDGSGVLASGTPGINGKPGVWIISFTGATPRMLREDAMDAAPSPDGRNIAFTTLGRSEVWIAGIDGAGERSPSKRILLGDTVVVR